MLHCGADWTDLPSRQVSNNQYFPLFNIIFCPRLMYAARDITNTVGSLGLITSSIISKKVAEGISSLVLDIKWGKGCYQETLEKAEEMAAALKQVLFLQSHE